MADLMPWNGQATVELASCSLEQLETVIRENLTGFLHVGAALLVICEQEKFQEAGFTSFGAYLRDRFGITRRYGEYLINATRWVDRVRTAVRTLPPSEGEIRPLAKLPEPSWLPIAQAAQRSADKAGEPLQAKHWKAAVREWRKPCPPADESADDLNPSIVPDSMQDFLAKASDLDAIITDPPYPEEYLPLYGELARLASEALHPNGLLAVMCGQSYLPAIIRDMGQHLPYRWTMAYLTPGGQSPQIWPRKVNTFWKPILLFGAAERWLGDVVHSDTNDNDKRFHDWGQSVSGMIRLVEALTIEGHLVCDPFLGAGTTGVACVLTGRRFTGCDIDPEQVKIATARLEDARRRQEADTKAQAAGDVHGAEGSI